MESHTKSMTMATVNAASLAARIKDGYTLLQRVHDDLHGLCVYAEVGSSSCSGNRNGGDELALVSLDEVEH